jgi:hypothetical protein
MDHQEQHHEEHRKEREHEIHSHAVHTGQAEKKDMLPFHPAWLVVVGTVLILIAMTIWNFLILV